MSYLLCPSAEISRATWRSLLVRNGERRFGAMGFSISVCFSWVSFVLDCLWSLTCAIRTEGSGLSGASVGPGSARRTLVSEAALLKRGCSSWSRGSGGRRSRWWGWLEHARSEHCGLHACAPFGAGRYLTWACLWQKPHSGHLVVSSGTWTGPTARVTAWTS